MIPALLIELGWKSALACGVALLASQALRGRPAAQRVAMLRAGIAALLLLPLLILTVPVLEIAVLPAVAPLPEMPVIEIVSVPVAPPETAEIDWIALAYGAGAALVLLRLAIGLALLHRWTRHAVPASNPVWLEAIARAADPLKRPVRLLVSPRVPSPLSHGVVPATILIGPDTERCPDRAAAVIAHEMAHVRRFDWPAMLAARIALALYWFNPLAWLLVVELARQTELAADEDAVTRVARTDYAQALLAVAGGCGAHAACGMAVTRSALGRRIRRVLDAAPAKPASGLLCAVLIGSVPLGIAPLAAMQLVPVQSAPERQATESVRQPAPQPARIAAAEAKPAQAVTVEAPKVRRMAPRRAPATAPVSAGLEPPLAMMRTADLPAGAAFRTRFQAKMERWRVFKRTSDGKVAPGTEATVQAEETGLRMAKAALAAKEEGKPPAGTIRGAGPDQRFQVQLHIQAASHLRAEAQDYRNRARDTSLSPDVRESYYKAASSLRAEAEKLEKQARQMQAAL